VAAPGAFTEIRDIAVSGGCGSLQHGQLGLLGFSPTSTGAATAHTPLAMALTRAIRESGSKAFAMFVGPNPDASHDYDYYWGLRTSALLSADTGTVADQDDDQIRLISWGRRARRQSRLRYQ
jgi:hypothetical protein